jgi:hypothetical protein
LRGMIPLEITICFLLYDKSVEHNSTQKEIKYPRNMRFFHQFENVHYVILKTEEMLNVQFLCTTRIQYTHNGWIHTRGLHFIVREGCVQVVRELFSDHVPKNRALDRKKKD